MVVVVAVVAVVVVVVGGGGVVAVVVVVGGGGGLLLDNLQVSSCCSFPALSAITHTFKQTKVSRQNTGSVTVHQVQRNGTPTLTTEFGLLVVLIKH
jgi:hypothetical protein